MLHHINSTKQGYYSEFITSFYLISYESIFRSQSIDNSYQCCLVAPTEILALQHFDSFSKHLNGLNLNIELLTGSTKKSQR